MTELLIILVIIAIAVYVVKRPSKFTSLDKAQETISELPTIRDIEDSSLLKAELAATQEKVAKLNQELGQLQSLCLSSNKALEVKCNQFQELSQKFDKLQHQKKSSEVKTGTFVEILAPIAEQFCVDPKTMRFLGSPIDYISFDYETDMITFVEVKSGESQLNENQRRVKKMVENGRVEFKVVRLNEKGIKVK